MEPFEMTDPNQRTFENGVVTAFDFLVARHGYSLHVDSVDGAVVFTNSLLSIRVFRERGSHMTYVEVRREETGESYVLHEIVAALAPDETLSPQCSSADSTKMAHCLAQLSQLCQRHLQGILAMDVATFKKVAESASANRKRRTLEAQYGPTKDLANLAWERKDWGKARELYETAKPALSQAEQRRLDFLLGRSP